MGHAKVIVDTSAIMAIFLAESIAPRVVLALEQSTSRMSISAVAIVEATTVMRSRGGFATSTDFDHLIVRYDIAIEPVTEARARSARDAYERYGRGSGSKAKLNFGDCFAYALAREKNEPLLFVGDDFSHTDITPALEP